MAEQGVLHTVIRQHLETFLAEASGRAVGVGLPKFVEQEFREFLTCGVLAHGFAQVRCDTCAFERLVPFSCKATIEDPWIVEQILTHLGLPSEPVRADPAQPSPASASDLVAETPA